jgi:hypothetical protein
MYLGFILKRYFNITALAFCLLQLLVAVSAESNMPQESGVVYECTLQDFSQISYEAGVRKLMAAFEANHAFSIQPGPKQKVGLKVYTESGYGLAIPLPLLKAVICVLIERGFKPEHILIIGFSENYLREAYILPALSANLRTFEGCPVYALNSGKYQHPDWFYTSSIPSVQVPWSSEGFGLMSEFQPDKKSFLPIPLMFEVDFWINLPMIADHPAIAVNGALANATLWNVSNNLRFLKNTANTNVAAAEIAAIPELHATLAFTILTLQTYQYIGGPSFNAEYCLTEPLLLLSSQLGALDYICWEKMNTARLNKQLPALSFPPVFDYLKQLKLETPKQVKRMIVN